VRSKKEEFGPSSNTSDVSGNGATTSRVSRSVVSKIVVTTNDASRSGAITSDESRIAATRIVVTTNGVNKNAAITSYVRKNGAIMRGASPIDMK
jgi:hypothetical protein